MAVPQSVALSWNGLVAQLANMAVVSTTTNGNITVGVDTAFNTLLPQAVNYAELRIARDCDLQQSLTSNSYTLTPGNNQLQILVSDFVAVQTVGVTVSGALSPLLPVTKEYIQAVWGDPAVLAQPQVFAPYGGDASTGGSTYTNFLVGPYPDLNYPVQVTGTTRLPSLNQFATQQQANSGMTFISTWLPDLLIQASMVYIAEFQRDFGSANDNDPGMGGFYENTYQNLLKGAIVEEARKRFSAGAWSSMGPTPIATPTR